MKAKLMTHLIAHYPNKAFSLAAARGMIDGGAVYLEVQFPFSDPSADGPVIQAACQKALDSGFSIDQGFDFVTQICQMSDLPVFVMCYANQPFRYGIDKFLKQVRISGGRGVIVPDLVPGSDEGLYQNAAELGLTAVPVVAPGISDARIHEIAQLNPEFLYASLRKGITGSRTALGQENLDFLERLNGISPRLMAGFGIQDHEQAALVCSKADAAIVGSDLVRTINTALESGSGEEDLYKAVREKVYSLTNG